MNYSTFSTVSSVHSIFFAFGLRRRTNHAMSGNPIITMIYWSIHSSFDHPDLLFQDNQIDLSEAELLMVLIFDEPNVISHLDDDHCKLVDLQSN